MKRRFRLMTVLALAAVVSIATGAADASPEGDAYASNIYVTLVLEGDAPPDAEFTGEVLGSPFDEYQTRHFTPSDLGPRLSIETIGGGEFVSVSDQTR